MSTNFEQGQTLGRGDLDVFLTDASGNPTNAYEISYAVYFVDPSTGAETLIGPAGKIPANPTVGEYYAAMRIPNGAEIGCYRIRWIFRETASSPQEGAVQQFGVIGPQQVTVDPYSPCVRDLINKMRVLTRDNCLAGSAVIELDAGGEVFQATLEEIYDAIGDISPPPPGEGF